MFWEIYTFAVARRLERLSTHVYFLLFGTLSFLAILAAGNAFERVNFMTGGTVNANSPYTLFGIISVLSYLSILIIAALHAASLVGQQLSSDQMVALRERLDRTLQVAGLDDKEDGGPESD